MLVSKYTTGEGAELVLSLVADHSDQQASAALEALLAQSWMGQHAEVTHSVRLARLGGGADSK
jgi:hypothetical protein